MLAVGCDFCAHAFDKALFRRWHEFEAVSAERDRVKAEGAEQADDLNRRMGLA